MHVIGTTGLSHDQDERVQAAARHAVIIKSGNMSLGVNLLAAMVRKAAAMLMRISISKSWRCITA